MSSPHLPSSKKSPRRVIAIVIDALGVGAMPDVADYDDLPTVNTMGGIDREAENLRLPTLQKMGLGNILPLSQVPGTTTPIASFGKMAELSKGKDTTTGHWEMAGIILEDPFPTYPTGFPPEVIEAFIAKTGCGGVLCNAPASGTQVIADLGDEHCQTGFPIVYTSADSVFQIATHVETVPLETLYRWCEVAREILQGEHQVSRVIARPFEGQSGAYTRRGGDRHDYAVPPPEANILQRIHAAGGINLGVGKIEDIFCSRHITHAIHTQGNTHGLSVTGQLIHQSLPLDELGLEQKSLDQYPSGDRQFIFINLVDTDMKFGHRRDVAGYARALEEIDTALGQYLDTMTDQDLLLITGDHGCDPTAPGTDHTREYVPILMWQKDRAGENLGIRGSFADMGQTVLTWLGISGDGLPGRSMLVRKDALDDTLIA